MNCATPQALDALQGRAAPTFPAMVERPSFIHPPRHPPPPDRTIYGTSWDNHIETAHFTIQWWSDSVSESQARASAEALEMGWQAFIEEQGWKPPVSSDSHYIWVLLDPDLGSTTGYTTEYVDSNYPEGLPVIYLNPTTLRDFGEPFYTSLCVHELMHAIQYGTRDYSWADDSSDTENWYWEASATHASELADPSVDGHQYASAWYADQPHLRYDSYVGSHQYGMFVFNAWLDEHHGAGTMQAVWTQAESMSGTPWPDIIEATTGSTAAQSWAGFTHAYGNEQMEESDLYGPVTTEGALEDGSQGRLDQLGTHYWTVSADVVVTPDSDDIILAGALEPGASVRTHASTRLSVTALNDGTKYALSVSLPGSAGDTGASSGSDEPQEDDNSERTPSGETGAGSKSSGCHTVENGARSAPWVLLGLASFALGLRRRA